MQHEIEDLKRQAKPLNTPDTFAQCAKLERKALALEKTLTRLQTVEHASRSAFILRIPGILRTIGFFTVISVSILVYYRTTRSSSGSTSSGGCSVGVGVTMLPPDWIWPAGRWLSMGTGSKGMYGIVGLIPWTLMCSRVSRALLFGGA